jgi:hypothetical protein
VWWKAGRRTGWQPWRRSHRRCRRGRERWWQYGWHWRWRIAQCRITSEQQRLPHTRRAWRSYHRKCRIQVPKLWSNEELHTPTSLRICQVERVSRGSVGRRPGSKDAVRAIHKQGRRNGTARGRSQWRDKVVVPGHHNLLETCPIRTRVHVVNRHANHGRWREAERLVHCCASIRLPLCLAAAAAAARGQMASLTKTAAATGIASLSLCCAH